MLDNPNITCQGIIIVTYILGYFRIDINEKYRLKSVLRVKNIIIKMLHNVKTSDILIIMEVNQLMYSYIKTHDYSIFKKCLNICLENNLFNLCSLLIYKHLYYTTAEERLKYSDPDLYIIYGKCLKELRR